MREAVERHGGEVLRTLGDGLITVFPQSVAGSLSAAVDMHRAIDRMGKADPLLRLQIRVGVSVGEASLMDGDWTGTPIFEAARLESKARPGSILVNDVIRVLIGTRGGFEFTPVGALELKGFPEPLPACEVAWEPDPGLPEVPLPSALEVGLDWPLIGRADDADRLLSAWTSVVDGGRAEAIAVTGEAGIGKTRLLAELAARVQGGADEARGTVVYGRCDAGGDAPLAPLAEGLRWWVASVSPVLLRTVVGDEARTLSPLVPSLAARLPELVGGSAASDVSTMADSVVKVVAAIADATGPCLVVLDAAHAADRTTLATAARLAALDVPVLMVILSRDPASADGVDLLALDGLDRPEVAELLEHVTGRAGVDELPPGVVDRAAAETHGNPRLVIEAGERLVSSGALGLAEGTGRDAAVRRALSGASPYKGLLAYQADDADDFFGRDEDVAGMLARLASTRLLAVVGASGSGKSSLVRAGVVPALRRGALAGSSEWPVVVFNAGPRPLLELAAGLGQVLERPVGEIVAQLESGADGLDAVARQASAARIVLVVDQFEEVFTACEDEAERQQFAATVLHAATVPRGPVMVILVMRGDFYARCADLAGLATALESTTVLLGPMDEPGLRAVIEGPARRGDLLLEAGLTEALIADVHGEPGGLPLLSHALYETWERREQRRLTLAGYRDAGGARGAIARTAEAVYTEQLDADQQVVARALFIALTELGEGTEDTRRRAPRSELVERAGSPAALDEVVETLVAARLITVGDDSAEVAHEAVIREWPRLRDWLDEDRDTLRAMRHLASSAREWDEGGREPADLYRGPRLAAGIDAAARGSLTSAEREFLEASQLVEEERAYEQARQNRRLRRLLVGTGAMLVVALVAGGIAFQQRSTAEDQRQEAQQSTEDADFERLTSQALNLVDSDRSLAFLLALEAHDLRDDTQSRSALFTTVQRNDDFLGYSVTEGVPTGVSLVDDDRVAYATDDGRFAMVDLATGQPVTDPIALGEPPPYPIRVFVARDHQRDEGEPVVVARGDTGQIWRIDPATGQPLSDPIETSQAIFGVAVAARLNRIAALLEDGTVAFWELVSAVPAGRFAAPSDPVPLPFVDDPDPSNGNGVGEATIDDAGDGVAVDFSPTDDEVAIQRADGVIEIWPVEGDGPRVISPTGDETINGSPTLANLVYHPDGGQVVGVDPARLDLHAVDAGSGAEQWRTDTADSLMDVAYTAEGDLYVSWAEDVERWSSETGETLNVVLTTGFGTSAFIGTSPDGHSLVVASATVPALGRWSTSGDSAAVQRFGSSGDFPVDLSPDGARLLMVRGEPIGGEFSVWDPQAGQRLLSDLPVLSALFSGDRTLAAFFDDLTAGQFDLESQQRIPPQLELSPGGVTAAVASASTDIRAVSYNDGRVLFFDRSGDADIPDLDLGVFAWVDDFSADGRRLTVRTEDRFHVYDL
ncbi:MAG: AAA family ATPase, partial [Acidimicrobiales bacterium]